jgi:cell wall-associated NlpC family hydrolase
VRRLLARGAGVTGGKKGPGVRRVTAITAAVIMAGGAGAVAYSQAAGAEPKPTIEQAQAQVNKIQSQVDQVGAQLDRAQGQLAAAQAKFSGVNSRLGREQREYVVARAALKQVAVASYEDMSQSSTAGLLTSGSPQTVLSQASLVQEIANIHNAQAIKFLSAARAVAAAQQQYDRTKTGISQIQSQLAAEKSKLNKLLASSQATLASLTLQQQQEVAAASIGGGITSATDPYGTSTPALKAVWFVYQQLGKPYLWGGTGPDAYDCSGLVQAAWNYAGVPIPRDTYSQWAALPQISKSSLAPGDLVFFEGEGHVGMYVGHGMMIDAPATGQVISLHPLDEAWYLDSYDGAARVP